MTQQEFDRLWDARQFDQIWNRDRAIAAMESMAKYPNGNARSRAEARRELRLFLESTSKAAPTQ
ncbi:hypothetical protein [Paraburkholderia aspalathi]|uniref:hypothetical protein n=1 Tax=Paraburkholderia aspalathi TaxID=1324617 RepID=UPI003CA21358